MTISQWLSQWASGSGGCVVRRREAVERKRRLARLQCGEVQMNDLDASHLAALVKACVAAGLSASSTKKAIYALKACIRDAWAEGAMSFEAWRELDAHCARAARSVKVTKNDDYSAWTPQEAALIVDTYHRLFPWAYPYVVTLFGTGMRISEALALTAQDVDCATGRCRITKSRDAGEDTRGTKTGRSSRVITLPAVVVQALRPVMPSSPWGLVFRGPQGAPLDAKNFNRRQHAAVLRELRGVVSRRPLRCARHTFAACQIDSGNMSVSQAAAYLGDDPETLTRWYYRYTGGRDSLRADDGLPFGVQIAGAGRLRAVR